MHDPIAPDEVGNHADNDRALMTPGYGMLGQVPGNVLSAFALAPGSAASALVQGGPPATNG